MNDHTKPDSGREAFNLIKAQAETFFEWPTADKSHVTTTSALLFAESLLEKKRAAIASLTTEHEQVASYCEALTERCVNDTEEIGKLQSRIAELEAHSIMLGQICALVEGHCETAETTTLQCVERMVDELTLSAIIPREERPSLPMTATPAMLDRAVSFALNVSLSSEYTWSQYMADLWVQMLAAAPRDERRSESAWQPIETAPNDGRMAIVFRPLALLSNDQPVSLKRMIGGNKFCWPCTVPAGQTPCNPTDGACHVTHWMPLPSPLVCSEAIAGGES